MMLVVPSVLINPLFTSTVNVLAAIVKPSTPTNETLSTPACKLVHFFSGAVLVGVAGFSLASTSANSVPVSFRPSSSAVPPFNPANAFTLLAPIVNTFTSVSTTSAPVRTITVSLFFSNAKPPLTWKNPKTSTSRFPFALIRSPFVPSISNLKLLAVPVETLSSVARVVVRLPSASLVKP